MSKITKKDLKNRRRTLSRLVCAQILYQYYFFEEKYDLEKLINDLLENYVIFEDDEEESYFDKIDIDFVKKLTLKVVENKEILDQKISELSAKSQEVEDFLLEILRLATCEIIFEDATQKNVIISEYTDISSLFFNETKINFVNSIIENLAKNNDKK